MPGPGRQTFIIGRRDGHFFAMPITGHSHGQHGHDSPRREEQRIIDPSTVLPKALLGGEYGGETLHYFPTGRDGTDTDVSQAENGDEALKQRLWEGWVLDGSVGNWLAESEMQVQLSLQAAQEDPKYLMKHFHRAVAWHDNVIKAELVLVITEIVGVLKAVGTGKAPAPAIQRLAKKQDAELKSLEESVKDGARWKDKGNVAGKKGKHELAIQHYLEGLLAVWPWTSGTAAMPWHLASSSGLAKLEQALLGNIATIALSIPARSGPKRVAFDAVATVASQTLLHMRYATCATLYKAFDRLSQLDEREQGEKARQGVNKLMADLFKDKVSDQWAHENCIREHVCHE